MFNQWQKPGLELLLKVWRREYIDWPTIEKELTPQKVCNRCAIMKYKECYAAAQWDKPHKQGECKVCVELRKEEGTPLDCRKCLQWKSALAFPLNKCTAGSDKTRVYVNCIETRQCKMCALHKHENDFTQSEWEKAAKKSDAQGKCRECMGKHEKLMWQCIVRKQTYDLSFYRKWLQHHSKNKTKLVRCDTCILADEQQRQQEHAKTFAMVQRHSNTPAKRAAEREAEPCYTHESSENRSRIFQM